MNYFLEKKYKTNQNKINFLVRFFLDGIFVMIQYGIATAGTLGDFVNPLTLWVIFGDSVNMAR
jgi:hypothetical protein